VNGIFIKNSLTDERARERKVKMVNVIITNTKIKVESTYNAKLVRLAKTVQGRWEKPYWVFPIDNEERVREILMEVYGEDGRPCETVSVDLILDDYGHGDCIFFGDLLLANRPGRDVRVRLASNVMVAKGNFNASGGSRNNPRVSYEEGTVIRVKDVPRALYERHKNDPGVVLVENTIKSADRLLQERKALLARIAEIDKELEKEGVNYAGE